MCPDQNQEFSSAHKKHALSTTRTTSRDRKSSCTKTRHVCYLKHACRCLIAGLDVIGILQLFSRCSALGVLLGLRTLDFAASGVELPIRRDVRYCAALVLRQVVGALLASCGGICRFPARGEAGHGRLRGEAVLHAAVGRAHGVTEGCRLVGPVRDAARHVAVEEEGLLAACGDDFSLSHSDCFCPMRSIALSTGDLFSCCVLFRE